MAVYQKNYASTFKANSRCSIFTFSRQYAEGKFEYDHWLDQFKSGIVINHRFD